MRESSMFQDFTSEATAFLDALSPLTLLFFAALLALSILIGRLLRLFVYGLWRLGLDRERRLASLGTVVQVALCALVSMAALGGLVRAAPTATFIVGLTLSPLLVLALHRSLRNAMAGVAILFRRTVIEGDQVTLEGGQKGIVRQIRLTTTLARTDAGTKLTIPNSRLLELVLEVDRRQAGTPVEIRVPVPVRPDEVQLSQAKKLALLSPFRTPNSTVALEYKNASRELIVSLRLPKAAAEDAARKELSHKLGALLAQGEKPQESVAS